jgi:hypothetical protein
VAEDRHDLVNGAAGLGKRGAGKVPQAMRRKRGKPNFLHSMMINFVRLVAR